MSKKIDLDFKVTDRLIKWSEDRHGYSQLPFLFISEFKNNYIAKGTKWDDWDKCFQNWINNNSPSGKYYDAKRWEDKIAICKLELNKKKPSEAIKQHIPDFKPPPLQKGRGYEALRELRTRINKQALAEVGKTKYENKS